MFEECNSLKAIHVYGSLETIGQDAFSNCSDLQSVTIEEGCQTIEAGAFYSCDKIHTLIFPKSLTVIGASAFNSCFNLSKVVFLGDAPMIGSEAFAGNITEIYYEKGNATWTEDVRQNCGGILYWIESENPGQEKLDIFSGICGKNTTWQITNGILYVSGNGKIDGPAWRGVAEHIIKVQLEPAITEIQSSMFCDCTQLVEFTIPETVITIKDLAFYNCTSLKKIKIPSSVTSIEHSAFANCTSLQSIDISNSVTTMGWSVFENCTSLTYVDLPDYLNVIEERLFCNCTKLEKVDIPNGVKTINTAAFVDCSSLASIDIRASIRRIGDYAFSRCTNLKTITFRGDAPVFEGLFSFDGVVGTGYYPKGNATWTNKAMARPNSHIKWYAKTGIAEEPKLPPPTWTLENGVLTILKHPVEEYWYERVGEIKKVVYAEGIKEVIWCEFNGAANIEEVFLPQSMITIGGYGFGGSRIKQIVFPENVAELGESIFGYPGISKTSLETVMFMGDAPTISANAFSTVQATVYYPVFCDGWTEEVLQDYGGNLTWIGYDINGALVSSSKLPMYRLYNPHTLEHMLTANLLEKEALIRAGWSLDGTAWKSPKEGELVYRLYNPYDDWHTYSTNQEEIDLLISLGWVVDGGVCCSATKNGGMPVYRLFNPYEQKNYHLLTASEAERKSLEALGWKLDGVAWYCLAN